jgi:hypothetical protein
MRIGVPLVTVAVLATLAGAAGAVGSRQEAAVTAVAELQLAPSVAGGPRGVGLFRQTGARLRGWVVVWGLGPHSKHAVHFHGPNSACGKKADPVAAHADLKADSKRCCVRESAGEEPDPSSAEGLLLQRPPEAVDC